MQTDITQFAVVAIVLIVFVVALLVVDHKKIKSE